MGVAIFLASCGGVDCDCNEITKKNGKYFRSGIYKEGDRASFGELFTGSCETLNDAGEVLKSAEYNNGYILNKQKWQKIDGELYHTIDMTYDNNRSKDGFRLKLEGQNGYLYPIEYHEYKDGKDVYYYMMLNGYGKTEMAVDIDGISSTEKDNDYSIDCLMEGYDISKSEMKEFLECISKEDLPKFFFKERK